MPSFDSDLLLYGLLAVAFLFFNYFVEWLRRKAQEQAVPEQETRAQDGPSGLPPADAGLEEHAWGRAPELARSLADVPEEVLATARAAAPTPRPTTKPRAPFFQSTRELRHAIVAMTVLGPCRALEPPERH